MSEWQKFRDKILREHPETRAEHERLGPLYELISEVVRRRQELGISQEELARRMGTD